MKKLHAMGIGPVIGVITFPWLAATIFLSVKYESSFHFTENGNRILFFIGLVMVILGGLIYLFTVPSLLKGIKNTRLITNGTYYLCCHPLYASIILFVIPGVSLLMNSWIVGTTSVLAYLVFKIFIRKENAEMESFFGEEFRMYRRRTPEFFPVPYKKWIRTGPNPPE